MALRQTRLMQTEVHCEKAGHRLKTKGRALCLQSEDGLHPSHQVGHQLAAGAVQDLLWVVKVRKKTGLMSVEAHHQIIYRTDPDQGLHQNLQCLGGKREEGDQVPLRIHLQLRIEVHYRHIQTTGCLQHDL